MLDLNKTKIPEKVSLKKLKSLLSSEFSDETIERIWNEANDSLKHYDGTIHIYPGKKEADEDKLSWHIRNSIYAEIMRIEEEKKMKFLKRWLETDHSPTVISCVLKYLGFNPNELIEGKQLSSEAEFKVFKAAREANETAEKCLSALMRSSNPTSVLEQAQDVLNALTEIKAI